jgi:hypothetical protein
MSKRWRFDTRYLLAWVRDGGVLWTSVLIALAIGFGMSLLPFRSTVTVPDRIRYAGLLYEFIGVSIVAIVVYRARDSLGAEPLYRIWIDYFRRFVGVFHRSDEPSKLFPVSSSSSVGVEMNVKLAPLTGTVEDKIEQLFKRVADLRTGIDNVQ